jgi:asparagine synthase (glutamine-hydrolysing)
MCGFLVAIERGQPVNRQRFDRALDLIAHRGPDSSGTASFVIDCQPSGAPVNGLAGFRRLAIQDLDARSNQPFRCGTDLLVYNGEIYNFRALAAELTAAGHHLRTTGDTEVLSLLLATLGLDGLERANGMWAFCRIDESNGTLLAARDRFGKKPLFYYADATCLCLASEMAPILAYLGRRPALKPAALDAYLASGWLFPAADTATHLADINQVPPGGTLEVDLASWTVHTGRYHDIRGAAAASPAPSQDALAELLRDAVEARLISDRPVGLMLSGGVDSSLILSVLASLGRLDQVRCYSGDAGKSEDASYARQAIARLGVEARMIPLDYQGSSLDRFLTVCRHQEKPFPFIGNALAAPELYAAIAADGVPVVLDGAGADELFGGYFDRTYRFAVAEAAARGDHSWLRDTLQANADRPALLALAQASITAVANGTFGGSNQGSQDPAMAALVARFALPGWAAPEPLDPLTTCPPDLTEALIRDAAPGGRLHEWLWQNDRNAMAAGLENRSPFLDFRLLPALAGGYHAKFVGPWNKHEVRPLFDRFKPLATQWRRDKQGFRWVYGRFMRHNRKAIAELIAASTLARARIDTGQLLHDIAHDDELLISDLTQRLLCVAGLEASMDMQLAA